MSNALRNGIPKEQKEPGFIAPELAKLHDVKHQTREERAKEISDAYLAREAARNA